MYTSYVTKQQDIEDLIKIWAISGCTNIAIASNDYNATHFIDAIAYLHECIDNPKHKFIPWIVLYRN